ncbi:MAG: methyl-accepting chemotaxis protein [Deferrisomatales bacterium]|nr:methyl-accepting chemotaxis protein [Deferrisomatales bacterium]
MQLRLATKFNFLTITLIVTTALGIAFYQTRGERAASYADLLGHGLALAAMVAQNSEFALYTEDEDALNQIVASTFQEGAVAYAAVFSGAGQALAAKTRGPEDAPAAFALARRRDAATGATFAEYHPNASDEGYIDILAPVARQESGGFAGLLGDDGGVEPPAKLGFIQIGFSLEPLAARARSSLFSALVFTAAVICVGGVLTLMVTRRITAPIQALEQLANAIAEGEGDLTTTFVAQTRDEVGALATGFNRFLSKLREMVDRIRSTAAEVGRATDTIRTAAGAVGDGTRQQSTALDEGFHSIRAIDEAAAGIAGSAATLLERAEESSATTEELDCASRGIAAQMESLFGSVDLVTGAIGEMFGTAQQITSSVESLSAVTMQTAASVQEMAAAVVSIRENAERTNQLSEEAAADAERGQRAVEETIAGIGGLEEMVDHASGTILDLGEQLGTIDRILEVIGEVTDMTSLLALNAAILAAQAGQHGKGFSVVASEIRDLAERTVASTTEIGSIVESLQRKGAEAVAAMASGGDKVKQEVARSRVAGAALDKILASTARSTDEVRNIVVATQQQERGTYDIAESMTSVSAMLDSISASIQQQTAGLHQLLEAAAGMRDIAAEVKGSTVEQVQGSEQIALITETIRSLVEGIAEATRHQMAQTGQVVEVVSGIRTVAEGNARRTEEMDRALEELVQNAGELEAQVGAFKTA